MTPDQSLKAAILGETVPARAVPEKTPDTPAAQRAATGPSRVYRWAIRLIFLTLIVLIARGAMNSPEVRALWTKGKSTVLALLERTSMREAPSAPAETPTETLRETETPAPLTPTDMTAPQTTLTQEQRPEPDTQQDAPADVLPAPTDADPTEQAANPVPLTEPVPEPSAETAQLTAAPPADSGADDARLYGPVTAILAGNLMDVDDVTVLVDDLACPAPDTEEGRFAALGLARITRAATLECDVMGEVGDAALRAACFLPDGAPLASRMKAETACQ